MKRTIAVPSGWALAASLMLALTVLPGEAAQRAVPRGGSGDGQSASSPPPQESAPAPQGARAPSTSGDSGRAAPRSGSSGSSPSAATAPKSGSSSGRTAATSGSSGGSAVPYGRPRDGSATGVAVARTGPPPPRGGSDFPSTYYYPTIGYYPWGYGGYGFGGYYGSGFYGSGYYGNGYYGSGYYGGLYDSWGYGYPRNYSLGFADDGALRLKIKPNGASVFVDGYFAGQVDDFDGLFQRLHLEPGPHRIEVRADGFEPLFFDVRILPDRTVTYTGELKRN